MSNVFIYRFLGVLLIFVFVNLESMESFPLAVPVMHAVRIQTVKMTPDQEVHDEASMPTTTP